MITLDVEKRLLHADITDEVLKKRKAQKIQQPSPYSRGYVNLYVQHVEQAHLGADFDFLRGSSGSEVTRDSH